MPFFPRTKDDIIRDSINKIRENTRITQLSPGSKTRFFLETVGMEQGEAYDLFDSNLLQPFIRYADSRFLDYFGDMLNIRRYEASHAQTSGENFLFYVNSGTFGDINGGSGFTIPAGTRVTTPTLTEAIITPGITQQPIVTYTLTQDVACSANQTLVFGQVRSSVEGSESSVPRNTLTEHNFLSYTKSNQKLLKCTNKYDIDNGVNRESDVSYRYRLENAFNAKSLGTFASIRLAALSVPGVSDVTIINAEQGPGTYGIYIDSITTTVSPSLIARVSEAVNTVTAHGIRAFVSGPRMLGLELICAIHWSPRATNNDISVGYVLARNAVEGFLNSTRIGQEVSFVDLIDLILRSSSYIQSIGKIKPNQFEQIYLYHPGPDGISTARNAITGERISPLYNEQVILETGNRYRGIQFISF